MWKNKLVQVIVAFALHFSVVAEWRGPNYVL